MAMFTTTFQDFFYETALPALKGKAWATYKDQPKRTFQLFRTENTDRGIVQFSQMAGVGGFSYVAEGADTPTDDFVQGFDSTFKPLKYGLGIGVTEELQRRNKIGLMAQRSVALGHSLTYTIESQGASVFNNAFATTGPDGQVLCAAAHPLIKSGGTQSNLGATADLSESALELELTNWQTTKTAEGFYQAQSKPKLLIHPSEEFNAIRILRSEKQNDTANNATNAVKDSGAVNGFISWTYLTDIDTWFLVAPPDETGLVWVWERQPYTRDDYIEKNETGYLWMRYWATCGFSDWRGVRGTVGA